MTNSHFHTNSSSTADGKNASGGSTPSTPDDSSTSDPSVKAIGRPVSGREASAEGAGTDVTDPTPVRWAKRVIVVAGAIVTIGGAAAVISQTTHILGGLSHSSPHIDELARSPALGLTFYQDGGRDPMSLSAPDGTGGTVNVSMQPEPFEVWFPTLDANSSLNICTSGTPSIFSTATRAVQTSPLSCLNGDNSAADAEYASGDLFETMSQYIIHTDVGGTRAQPASGGDEQYYVSNLLWITNGGIGHQVTFPLTNEHGNLYLVVYLNTNNYRTFQSGNVEDFILDFG